MNENEQESEKRETVADIVEMLRANARGERFDSFSFTSLADRIEAAWKRERGELDNRISELGDYAKLWTDRADELRLKCDEFYAKAQSVGNAAAMREALQMFVDSVEWLCDGDKFGRIKRQFAVLLSNARAALSAPPRQCDVGTSEEQTERLFRQHGDMTLGAKVALAWAQMPYKDEEGGEE